MNQLSRYIRGPLILVALLVIARYLFPSKMTFFWEVSTFGIYIIANDILYGYMGMVSFGQPFYLGVGAYAAAIYLAHIGHNIFIAISLAILAGLAGAEGAYYNVLINLNGIEGDDAWVAETRERADKALYRAKRLGRDRIELDITYEPEEVGRSPRRRSTDL